MKHTSSFHKNSAFLAHSFFWLSSSKVMCDVKVNHLIYPLFARVVGAPQMISQPVSSSESDFYNKKKKEEREKNNNNLFSKGRVIDSWWQKIA